MKKIFHLDNSVRERTIEELLFHDKRLKERWDEALSQIEKENKKSLQNFKFMMIVSNLIYLMTGIGIGMAL
jgi:hypothetical protein